MANAIVSLMCDGVVYERQCWRLMVTDVVAQIAYTSSFACVAVNQRACGILCYVQHVYND